MTMAIDNRQSRYFTMRGRTSGSYGPVKILWYPKAFTNVEWAHEFMVIPCLCISTLSKTIELWHLILRYSTIPLYEVRDLSWIFGGKFWVDSLQPSGSGLVPPDQPLMVAKVGDFINLNFEEISNGVNGVLSYLSYIIFYKPVAISQKHNPHCQPQIPRKDLTIFTGGQSNNHW